ncbi:MAG: diacylglycerol kinase family protein [Pseudobdellovibrionaceae bacterium]
MRWTNQDKIYVIVNAKAGLGSGTSRFVRKILGLSDREDMTHAELLARLKEELCAHAFDCQIAETASSGHGTELARQAVEQGYKAVIAVGGDGTINEVATGLKGTDVALGIIPFGTANLLAMEMGIPCAIKEACDVIRKGQTRRCDMGEIGGKNFVVMAGVGLDAYVVRSVTSTLKEQWGALSYVIQTVAGLCSYRLKPITVELPTGEKFSPYFIFIQNGRFYAGKYLMAPAASMQDGYLDMISVMRPNPADVMAYLLGQGKKHPAVRVDKITSCRLTDHHLFECDGDFAGEGSAEVKVIPNAIEIIC